MKIQSQILVTAGLFFAGHLAWAQQACLSGSPQNTSMINQMTEAKKSSAITGIIYKQYELGATQEGRADCVGCKESLLKRPGNLEQIASAAEGVPSAPQLLFKPECLQESNGFDSTAREVSCPSGSRSTTNLCQTTEIMTYQNAVISSFLSCAKKLGLPTISPSMLYRIYSLESGFRPQYSSRNGVGLGQQTSIFVKDINQPWRGGGFLNKIAQTDLKECDAAKIIAQTDLKSKPVHSNSCSFIQIGSGLERNILYTIIGMAIAWEKDILPKMKAFATTHANHPNLEEIKSLTMANAYGAGGRVAARAIASRLSSLSPEEYLAAIQKPLPKVKGRTLNIYTLKMAERQSKIGEGFTEPLKSLFAKQGAQACINP